MSTFSQKLNNSVSLSSFLAFLRPPSRGESSKHPFPRILLGKDASGRILKTFPQTSTRIRTSMHSVHGGSYPRGGLDVQGVDLHPCTDLLPRGIGTMACKYPKDPTFLPHKIGLWRALPRRTPHSKPTPHQIRSLPGLHPLRRTFGGLVGVPPRALGAGWHADHPGPEYLGRCGNGHASFRTLIFRVLLHAKNARGDARVFSGRFVLI